MPFLSPAIDRLSHTLGGWPRRLAAFGCLLLTVIALVTGRHPPDTASDSATVVVTTRDLTAGATLTATDVRAVRWPRHLVPSASFGSPDGALGHPIGASMSRGEPLTRSRLLDTAITAGLRPGQVAVTVTLGGHHQGAILAAGSSIDLYSTDDSAAGSSVDGAPAIRQTAPAGALVASALRVLAVLSSLEDDGPSSVVLAADAATATRLARQTSVALLATLRPPS